MCANYLLAAFEISHHQICSRQPYWFSFFCFTSQDTFVRASNAQVRCVHYLHREFGLKNNHHISSIAKADMLTRVKKAWLQEKKDMSPMCCVKEDLKDLRNMHHFGKERTLYLVWKVNPNITIKAVNKVVRQCREC